MSEIMIDLETLSTRSNAVIIVLAGIKFSRKEDILPLEHMETFYRRIDIDSCTEVGLHIDDNTIKWWNDQEDSIRYEAMLNPVRDSLKNVLNDFKIWIQNSEKIWGNGSDFDCSILAEAYKRCDMKVPWKYYNTRDVRTIFDLGKIYYNQLPDDNKHHALYDCYRQIVGVKKAFKKLGN